MPDLSFVNKEMIDSIGNLISNNGPWIAFLIFCAGTSFRLDKIVNTIRQFFKDRDTHTRKSRELDHRIQRDAHIIGMEIDKKMIGEPKSKKGEDK